MYCKTVRAQTIRNDVRGHFKELSVLMSNVECERRNRSYARGEGRNGLRNGWSCRYCCTNAVKISFQIDKELYLLLDIKVRDYRLEDRSNCDMMLSDECRVVDIGKHPHQKSICQVSSKTQQQTGAEYALAIHTIGHTTVSRNAITEILEIERPLEARGKEPSEWRDEGSERR
jgi:hypothetical protein